MHNHQTAFHQSEPCLNCGVPLIGKYCSECGQKKLLHKNSFMHMVLHFISDYFHYDGKFLLTLKTMFTNPGKITTDFINGKRARFLNPIQFYFFVSTVFFLFMFQSPVEEKVVEINGVIQEYKPPIDSTLTKLADTTNTDADSVKRKTSFGFYNSNFAIGKWTPKEKTHQAYITNQNSKPKDSTDGWLKKLMIKKFYKVNAIKKSGDDILENYFGNFAKSFPKALFILLPLFALLLHVFFRKSKLYYVDHAIHCIHLHSFLFIIIFLVNLFSELPISDLIVNIFYLITFISVCIYFSMSFKNVYYNSWPKTITKQILLFTVYFICFAIVLLALLILSFFML